MKRSDPALQRDCRRRVRCRAGACRPCPGGAGKRAGRGRDLAERVQRVVARARVRGRPASDAASACRGRGSRPPRQARRRASLRRRPRPSRPRRARPRRAAARRTRGSPAAPPSARAVTRSWAPRPSGHASARALTTVTFARPGDLDRALEVAAVPDRALDERRRARPAAPRPARGRASRRPSRGRRSGAPPRTDGSASADERVGDVARRRRRRTSRDRRRRRRVRRLQLAGSRASGSTACGGATAASFT